MKYYRHKNDRFIIEASVNSEGNLEGRYLWFYESFYSPLIGEKIHDNFKISQFKEIPAAEALFHLL